MNSSVEGVTIVNSAFHSIIMTGPYRPQTPTDVRWVKIVTWRANGDGINPMRNGLVEDCFIRTQDDSSYVNGRGIRRTVMWQDANGSSFVLTPLGLEDINTHPVVIEDVTVVYSRWDIILRIYYYGTYLHCPGLCGIIGTWATSST